LCLAPGKHRVDTLDCRRGALASCNEVEGSVTML
jgi:hypothetical protein